MLQLPQSDVLELYRAQAQETLDNYNNRTTRQKYAKSEAYVAFRQAIYVRHESSDLKSRVPDTALGGTASKRGDAACSGVLTSRCASLLISLY